MPFTQHELELRKLAADRIANRLLPDRIPEHLWAGQGSGQPCSLCDQPLKPDQVEYELEIATGADQRTYRFHVRCHAVWQLALTNGKRT